MRPSNIKKFKKVRQGFDGRLSCADPLGTSELSSAVEVRQRLDAQLNENDSVQKVDTLMYHLHQFSKDLIGIQDAEAGKHRLQAHRARSRSSGS